MTLYDLQALDVTHARGKKPDIKGSRASKGCVTVNPPVSSLSILLCGGPSLAMPEYDREMGV